MAEIKTVTIDELCQMNDQEGLILQGCGGDLQEWVDGINELLSPRAVSCRPAAHGKPRLCGYSSTMA